MQYEAQKVMAAPTPNLLGLGSWPLTSGLGSSPVLELTAPKGRPITAPLP